MQILLNSDNLITSYAIIGGFDGGIEIDDSILPDTFIPEFKSGKFLYENEKVTYNNNFQEGIINETPIVNEINSDSKSVEQLKTMVSNLQKQSLQGTKLSMQMAQQNAKATQKIVELEKEIEKLKEAKGVE
ncbi:DUF2977 domain-containing protein [Staphylococcus edaphicus]|uniref:DUF2977 domain-containing protein n=1 Tax=Staphylococcus edaphicus TaxID=1955013 RepID=A0A2C6UAR0_9STAP|nr:DUF2977 domain-containing protein [Staphylococcus edaphicus]PHK50802.1 hypothetical protein BTJ66_00415 [Staphylococcus edaphicus]UQW82497.1 DUF2977 domain-containing protein [Staphylococcus edaphicus]